MQAGTIQKIISYYLQNERFLPELGRAQAEFFDLPPDGLAIAIVDKYEPYFMEWLVFDFRLKNGRGLLEDYYDCNPRKRPLYEMQVYRDLQTNVFGMVEVQKVYLDEGLDLLMLHTGEKYFVHEHKSTFQLKKGNLIFVRIAAVGGQYELVGSDSIIFPIKIDSFIKKSLIDKNKKLTPKDVIKFLDNKDDQDLPRTGEVSNIDLIKANFDDFLVSLGVNNLISTDLIQKWLAEINFEHKDLPIVDILVGLADHWPEEDEFNYLLELTSDLLNNSPQKALKGKSPNDLVRKNPEAVGSKGFTSSIRRIGGKWGDYANKATEYLQDMKIPKAVNHFEKAFRNLLKEKTTGRYVFALFANLGVCYMYFGSEFMARKLLEISIKLKPNYEFGKKMLAELDSDQQTEQIALAIRFALERARVPELKDFWRIAKNYSDGELRRAYYEISLADNKTEWERDLAKKYYDFLKILEIDFSDV